MANTNLSDGANPIERLLADRGLTAAELARQLEVDESQVSRWRAGTRMPGRAALARLFKKYKIPPTAFDATARGVE